MDAKAEDNPRNVGELALDLALEPPTPWTVGLIALATDHTTERDFLRMLPPDKVALYTTRVANENPTTIENLRRMGPRIADSAALLLPEERLDAVVYSCTSGTVAIGYDSVAASIRSAKPGAPCITPPTAAVAALNSLGAKRIAILTPYIREVSESMGRWFAGQGFEVVRLSYLGMEDDREMACVPPAKIVEAGAAADHADAEAMFVSCTAFRAAEAAAAIERRIGKPVVTGNQAMVWHTLRTVGCEDPVPGYGRLLA